MIEFDHITCGYRRSDPIFEDLSFSLPGKAITIVLGTNGSGKTTLLKSLMRQLPLYSGSIKIDGTRIDTLSVAALSRLIAYVPQNLDQSIDYDVLDFISFGRTPYLRAFDSPTRQDRELARISLVEHGLEKLVGKSINSISGGERQLVYILRALVQQTPVIVMDEPMSALDFSNQAMILQVISDLAKSGKTVILSSHNPNHALEIDSYVCLIDSRRAIHHGAASSLLKDNTMLTAAFGEHVGYNKDPSAGYISFKL